MTSRSSLFPKTFAADACSAFRTLPRSGRIACLSRSRPCFAFPPAESPSTMNSSVSAGFPDEQSASFPGRLSRRLTARFLVTCLIAERDAARAFAAWMIGAAIAWPVEECMFRYCSSVERTTELTADLTPRLFNFSFVCP